MARGLVLGAVLWMGLASLARASEEVVVFHQGRLLTLDDAPVEGTRRLGFSLFRLGAGGGFESIWSEEYEVPVQGGRYGVGLGSGTDEGKAALSAELLEGARWLGVSIDGVELLPRLSLGWVPSALRAQRADEAADARRLGGVEAALLVDAQAQTLRASALPVRGALVNSDGALSLGLGSTLKEEGGLLEARVGTEADTVAAGDDARIVNAVQQSAGVSGDLSGNVLSPRVEKVLGVEAGLLVDETAQTLRASALPITGVLSTAGGALSVEVAGALTTVGGALALALGPTLKEEGGLLDARVGTGADTVAAGDDARIVNAVQKDAALSGDLSGAPLSPAVVALQGRPLSSAPPSNKSLLRYEDGAWKPATLAASDLPSLPASQIGSGTLPVARGGTGTGALSGDSLLFTNADGTALQTLSCGAGQIPRVSGGVWSCQSYDAVTTGGAQSISGLKTFSDGIALGGADGAATCTQEGLLRTDLANKRVEVCNGSAWETVKSWGEPCGNVAGVLSVTSAGAITCSDRETLTGATGIALTNGGHCGSGTFEWRCQGWSSGQTSCANYASTCGVTFTWRGRQWTTRTQCRTNSQGHAPSFCSW